MAAIIVKQQRIARISAQDIALLRVIVDRSLASAGGPSAGIVLTVPVTVETASIVLPQITLWETATAPDLVTQGAIYSTQLLDINGQVVGTIPGFGAFQLRVPSAQTTWNEIRESNDFLALIQSAVTNRLGLDTSPTLGQSVITVVGAASQAGLDTISLFFGGSPNPPGLRHNVATAQMEFSHDGLIWSSLGSGGGSGTVTSVGLSLPGIFGVSGSPVTVSGTLTATLTNQSANQVFAGPSSGGAAAPTFRALVANDYPTMIGDSGAGGTKGAVPAPAAGDAAANKFLKADGTWTALASAPVTSVFGRTGAVVAANGDYSFSQISGSVADGQLSANVTLLGNSTTGTGAIVRATSPTIVTPTIASFANANHSHTDAAGGGQLNATNIFNAGTIPVARLPILVGDSGAGGVAGLAPAPAAGDAAANKFLKADGTWATVPSGSPGGSSGVFQINNAGAFGGATGVVYAASGAPTVSITGQATSQLSALITGPNASSSPIFATRLGAGGSSGDLFQAQNNAGAALSVITSTGDIGAGIASSLLGRVHSVARAGIAAGFFQAASLDVSTVLIVRQGSGSTGNLLEAQNSGGVAAFTIPGVGGVILPELVAAPATPAANTVHLYVLDSGGVSTLFYKKDNGTQVEIGAGGGGLGDPGANGLVVRTALNTTTARTLTAGPSNGLAITDGNAVGGDPTVDYATINTSGLGYHLPGQGGLVFTADAAAAAVASANQVRVVLFYCDRRITVDRIGLNGVVDAASQNAGFGIYSANGNTKIVDSGAISTAAWSGANNFALTSQVTFGPGYFYLAWTASSTTPTLRCAASIANYYSPLNSGSGTVMGTATNTSSGGVLPATLGALTDASNLEVPILRFYKN